MRSIRSCTIVFALACAGIWLTAQTSQEWTSFQHDSQRSGRSSSTGPANLSTVSWTYGRSLNPAAGRTQVMGWGSVRT